MVFDATRVVVASSKLDNFDDKGAVAAGTLEFIVISDSRRYFAVFREDARNNTLRYTSP